MQIFFVQNLHLNRLNVGIIYFLPNCQFFVLFWIAENSTRLVQIITSPDNRRSIKVEVGCVILNNPQFYEHLIFNFFIFSKNLFKNQDIVSFFIVTVSSMAYIKSLFLISNKATLLIRLMKPSHRKKGAKLLSLL